MTPHSTPHTAHSDEAELLELPLLFSSPHTPRFRPSLREELLAFREFGEPTRLLTTPFSSPEGAATEVPTYVNEFWTARQRQASSLHEISYRACFKPQLPRFFIERLTEPGDLVYDPFMGRGTTPLEAALLGRVPSGNDANPLSLVFTRPRLRPPTLAQIEARLKEIPLHEPADMPEDLLAFYHRETLRQVSSLKNYMLRRSAPVPGAATFESEAGRKIASSGNGGVAAPEKGPSPRRSGFGRAGGRAPAPPAGRLPDALDEVDDWIRMVALNRLTGHSNGFFSVYTLPPNQAVSAKSQLKINERRRQVPPERDVPRIILKKSRQLLGDLDHAARQRLAQVASSAQLLTGPAHDTPQIPSGSVSLVVTSPPFLNVVQYATDNWLRCWFLGIDPKSIRLTVPRKIEEWQSAMTEVFRELARVLQPRGHVAFEVGEIHSGNTRLEEAVLPCAAAAGLQPLLIVINDQNFTKTANCWGVDNMAKGTNTNRIVLLRKP